MSRFSPHARFIFDQRMLAQLDAFEIHISASLLTMSEILAGIQTLAFQYTDVQIASVERFSAVAKMARDARDRLLLGSPDGEEKMTSAHGRNLVQAALMLATTTQFVAAVMERSEPKGFDE